jgi:hypothetical protein
MAKNDNTGAVVGLGVAAAAAAAAAGGAYWLYGAKHSAKHRKMAKAWMLKARAEVMEGIEKLEDIDKEKYMGVVESVLKAYSGKAGATPAEVAAMAKDFQSAWKHMQGKKKTSKRVPSKAKSTTKKTTRKGKKATSKSRR